MSWPACVFGCAALIASTVVLREVAKRKPDDAAVAAVLIATVCAFAWVLT